MRTKFQGISRMYSHTLALLTKKFYIDRVFIEIRE